MSATPKRPTLGVICEALFLVAALWLLLWPPGGAGHRSLPLIFASIVLEAMPFMLLGALAGGMVEAFLSRELMVKLLPRRGWVTVFAAAAMGLLFPVCECAIVPVTRRLARKGLPAAAAVAYLLGGPLVNPVTAASTALAYRFDWSVVAARLGLGYLIAVGVALLMGRLFKGQQAFVPGLDNPFAGMFHDHQHGPGCACGHAAAESPAFSGKLMDALQHAAADFLSTGQFLVVGAFVAALAQTWISREAFLGIASNPLLPTLLMMALAAALNLCSEADAFVAASFRGIIPLPAQMAFLLTGPMLDLKLLLMYQTLFRKRAILVLATAITLSVLAASLALAYVWRAAP